jgi:hypothetical protein
MTGLISGGRVMVERGRQDGMEVKTGGQTEGERQGNSPGYEVTGE